MLPVHAKAVAMRQQKAPQPQTKAGGSAASFWQPPGLVSHGQEGVTGMQGRGGRAPVWGRPRCRGVPAAAQPCCLRERKRSSPRSVSDRRPGDTETGWRPGAGPGKQQETPGADPAWAGWVPTDAPTRNPGKCACMCVCVGHVCTCSCVHICMVCRRICGRLHEHRMCIHPMHMCTQNTLI